MAHLNTFVLGTCDSMCPESEVRIRTKERILHYFEKNPLTSSGHTTAGQYQILVKEFARSAAGIRTPRPADLRSPAALQRTIDYLLEPILSDTRKPYWFVYEFIFDRLRCVRQEIVIQNLSLVTTIQLLEPIVLFLAYSSYRLCDVPIEHYDPYVCHQHFQECLKKLLVSYDELRRDDGSKMSANQWTFECLYLLLNLGNVEAIARVYKLPTKLVFDADEKLTLRRLCLDMSMNCYGRNYYRILLKMRRLPVILRGVATLKLQFIRREMFLRFCEAYHSRVLTVPIEWLVNVMIYASKRSLIDDCRHYKCEVIDGESVRFNKTIFDYSIEMIKPRQEAFVNDELFSEHCHVPKLLLLKT